ncbi:hypothetical protein DPMN_115662 [Dreissena polymorpha]|uniref:Uncharacterized protein n=1 Tax=Dreissena polymorpha TaxID=45954 RepID=A0A9D4KLK8_DREPO|nr:hypothetical protein DPMN_115662 [Dreissena polymorpha]
MDAGDKRAEGYVNHIMDTNDDDNGTALHEIRPSGKKNDSHSHAHPLFTMQTEADVAVPHYDAPGIDILSEGNVDVPGQTLPKQKNEGTKPGTQVKQIIA